MLVSWMLLLGACAALFGRLGGYCVGALFILRLLWIVLKPTLLTP